MSTNTNPNERKLHVAALLATLVVLVLFVVAATAAEGADTGASADTAADEATIAVASSQVDTAVAEWAQRGPYDVITTQDTWRHDKSQRQLPVTLRRPAGVDAAMPVVILSHGLGGTRDAYGYLADHLTSHGYVCINLQHVGSDDSVWRGLKPVDILAAMKRAANVTNVMRRAADVELTIDKLNELNLSNSVWNGKLDASRIAIVGHSFGAHTALAAAGMRFVPRVGEPFEIREPRIRAAVALSPPGPSRPGYERETFSEITVPVLHMTGTQDVSRISDTQPSDRRKAFDHITQADQYLLTLTGGDHMVFSGRDGTRGNRTKDPAFQLLIRSGVVAFLDAYLRDRPDALQWLLAGGYRGLVGAEGRWESHEGKPLQDS